MILMNGNNLIDNPDYADVLDSMKIELNKLQIQYKDVVFEK
mgnify:CR=1 FL=1